MFPIRDHNPSHRLAFVTWTLIVVNVAIHLFVSVEIDTERELMNHYFSWAMIPSRIVSGEAFHTVLSSMFLHGDIWHLAGNMLFLWIFGDNMEDTLGHLGFLGFYLACGAVAALAQLVAEPMSPIPVIGASGAIAGVMGGYLLLFPKARIDIFIFLIVFVRILPIPAWLMLGLWFLFQVVAGVGADPTTGGVAYWAHAGGFVIGLLLILPVWLWKGGTAFWARTHGVPPHPDQDWGRLAASGIPRVTRSRTGPPEDPRRRTPWGG
jgi:membrane associated rhomboid family serine protease